MLKYIKIYSMGVYIKWHKFNKKNKKDQDSAESESIQAMHTGRQAGKKRGYFAFVFWLAD